MTFKYQQHLRCTIAFVINTSTCKGHIVMKTKLQKNAVQLELESLYNVYICFNFNYIVCLIVAFICLLLELH